MSIPIVYQMKGEKGNTIPNQFIIDTGDRLTFQSENKTIFSCEKLDDENEQIQKRYYKNFIISDSWAKIPRTIKYLFKFLNYYDIFGDNIKVNRNVILKKIISKEIKFSNFKF